MKKHILHVELNFRDFTLPIAGCCGVTEVEIRHFKTVANALNVLLINGIHFRK